MASLGTISTLGEQLELQLKQGVTLKPIKHYLKNPDNSPVNLTGYSVRGSIKRFASDANPITTFDCEIAPDPTEGWYQFGLTEVKTRLLSAGSKITDPQSQYKFDIELIAPDTSVMCTVYGPVKVESEVTV